MSEKITSVYAAIKHQETRVAVGRGKVIRVYNRVSLPSLRRMSNSLPLVEKQDLSCGLGWKWKGAVLWNTPKDRGELKCCKN